MNFKNKILPVILFCFLACYSTNMLAQIKTFRFSNIHNEETIFTIKNNSVIEITNVAPYKENDYLNIVLFECHSELLIIRNGEISFDLFCESDGRYEISIFAVKAGIFIPCNKKCLIKKNGEYFFEIPYLYENNGQIYFSDKNPQDFLVATVDIQSDDEKIITKAKEITIDCTDDYGRVKAIHDWVANNIYYDKDAYFSQSSSVCDALGVLQGKKTVCQGYACLTAALLRSLQIPCRVVSGHGYGYGYGDKFDEPCSIMPESYEIIGKVVNHAWNEAYVSGRWVIMDVTWDSDMEYRNGEFNRKKGLRGWKYFDTSIEEFSIDHKYISL
ncbi:transglutaminase-like domain-containing protein [Bacteroidales bacterium OttesenSCG-928-I21]|nr:transglutaminase-like domain-containing protein [Bacteroidales bacterium OttesenSCG-928-I21]